MYEKSKEIFSEELFQNPTREYRGAPFWSWNGRLKKEKLFQQIKVFEEMGFGGFHIHARIGLETEYLGEEFLDLVDACSDFGDEHGLNTWLYDEDKWPSGVGGGRVTKDKRFAGRYLLFSPNNYPDGFLDRNMIPTSRLSKNGEIRKLCRFEVQLQDGHLMGYRKLQEGEEGENIWYAYLVVTEKLRWFNNEPYVDTLNPKATEKFIEVTHERYRKRVGGKFSETIPAIFTDEPSYHKQECLLEKEGLQDVGIAYTDAMEEVYRERYGESLLDHLPEIFWTDENGVISKVRYQYHDCCAEMFAENYTGVLGKWCGEHHLALTGHLLFEESLLSQTEVVGEVMRSLRFMTIPGIDMLADRHEYTTAKQAASIAHQYGKEGVMSELYGVTNWDFDFRGHKHQGDWQAALGVTLRVPHLAWMSMGGESKRDYPAPIDQHSPWYQKYPLIEDYFARVNTALTRGTFFARIGVIHPIESMWMAYGAEDETAMLRKRLDDQFWQVTEWLLLGLLDFDYISEALLEELYTDSRDGRFSVGNMAYDVILVPGLLSIRQGTLKRLKKFREDGGTVIFMGNLPDYVDGKRSGAAAAFAGECEKIGFDRWQLYEALEPFREIDIVNEASHTRSERLVAQIRQDGEEKWIFIAQGKHDNRLELNHWYTMTGREDMQIQVRGLYQVWRYDAMTGKVCTIPHMHKDGRTYIKCSFYAEDSYLLRLKAADERIESFPETPKRKLLETQYLPGKADYTLEEKNVVVLDQAEYRLDGKEWMPKEETLRLDNKLRENCGYPLRSESFPQPWLKPLKEAEHTLELRFTIESETEGETVWLGFEAKEQAGITWNGKEVGQMHREYFVDEAIRCEELGKLRTGTNELRLVLPFGQGTDIENCYLLGDFGVTVEGNEAVITKKPEKLPFGNMAAYRFPFYGGVVRYRCSVCTEEGTLEVEIPEYYGALVTVSVDGKEADLYQEPYRAEFPHTKAGLHQVELTLYGTRINTFGQLHNCNRREEYFGPKSFRTEGKNWSAVYQLRPTGITVTPIVRIFSEEEP